MRASFGGSGLPMPFRRTFAAASGPPLTLRRLRFAILAPLAAEAGSMAWATPR